MRNLTKNLDNLTFISPWKEREKRISVRDSEAVIVSVVLYPSSGAAWYEGSSGHRSKHDRVIAPGM